MDKNLANYVRILPEFIDKNSCNKILEEINHVGGWQSHEYHDTETDDRKPVNGERELDVNWNVDQISASNFLHQRVADATPASAFGECLHTRSECNTIES